MYAIRSYYVFPEGNGMELLRRLRAGALPTDVILITAARET